MTEVVVLEDDKQEVKVEEAIEDLGDKLEECLEDIKEEVEELKEETEKEPVVITEAIPIPVTEPIDYDLLADKVAARMQPVATIEEEEEEEEDKEPVRDEPPEHNSRLYKKLF